MKKAPVKEVKKDDEEDKIVTFLVKGAKAGAEAETNKLVTALKPAPTT